MIYVTSDLHFGHDKPFIYEPRGFATVKEMNEAIVDRWNSVVTQEDTVYVLGDIIMGDSSESIKYLDRLNGHIIIICGNHDSKPRRALYVEHGYEIVDAMYLEFRKYHFYLSHFPTNTTNNDSDKPLKARLINLCGHRHTKNPFIEFTENKTLSYHVECDAHNYTPILIDQIIEDIKKNIEENK